MGIKKKIVSPEKLQELFEAYCKDVKENPRTVTEFHGKDGNAKTKPLERPLTMVGFENYVFKQGLNADLSHYFCNLEKRYSDFVAICRVIRAAIRQDQIEGGMVGQYNPSITQRLNGLKEQQEVSITEQPLFEED